MYEKRLSIKQYIKEQKKICKQLNHWKWLSAEEQFRFEQAETEMAVDRLMTTSRQRAYNNQISKPW